MHRQKIQMFTAPSYFILKNKFSIEIIKSPEKRIHITLLKQEVVKITGSRNLSNIQSNHNAGVYVFVVG